MPVFRTLEPLAKRWGLTFSNSADQAVMLRFYNQALKELNETTDLFGSLAEIAIPLEAPSQITFPQNVVSLRGVRWAGNKIPYNIYPVTSKYCWEAWKNSWKAFVPLGYKPTERTYSVTGQLSLYTTVADSAEVVIVGTTTGSSLVEETIVMNATSKTTTNAFQEINAIVRKVLGTVDIKIKDSAGNNLATLQNNRYSTRYYTVDISQFPSWNPTASDECSRIADCLVKLDVAEVVSLYQEPPFAGYDDVLIDYCSYLWAKEKEQGDAAVAFKAVIDERLQQLSMHQTGAEQQSISFEPHPHDMIQPWYGKFVPNRIQRWP